MSVVALVMLIAPHALIGLFLDTGDPANAEAVRLAVLLLAVGAVFQVFDGAQSVGAGMLRGLQDTRVPMMIAALGYWVIGAGLAVGLGFAAGLQGIGVWFGFAGGLGAVSIALVLRWLRLTAGASAERRFAAASVG